jgi:hypothetical protein
MAEKKNKVIVKPKGDKQVMDGLGVSFEETMKTLSQPMKEPQEAENRWEQGLKAIEAKHSAFFASLEAVTEIEEFIMIRPGGSYVFISVGGELLPIGIQQEVNEVTRSIYPEQNSRYR